MRLTGATSLLSFGALMLSARLAIAQSEAPRRPVVLDGTCGAVPMSEVGAALRVELFNRYQEGNPVLDADRASVGCAGETVTIDVTSPDGLRRGLHTSLARSPTNVRARIVALAIAELVRDLDDAPRVAAPAVSPPKSEEVVAPSTPRARGRVVDLGAFGQASTFRFNGVWLGGGGLRFDYLVARAHLTAGLDAAALASDERFAQGSAQVLVAYVSPSGAWQESWGRMLSRVGVGYALGAARLTGHTTVAHVFEGTTSGAWTAPYAFAGVGVALTRDIRLEARAQVGWVTSPVVGEVTELSGKATDVALKGLWTTGQAGIAIAL